MQDFAYQDEPAEAPRGAATRRFVNFTGAVVSTALVIGMGVWGYKLMVRDVTGIPVIEAIDGAFRTQPENPGGLQTPHQGLQVNEIAAGGTASEAPDEVRLAPDPLALATEDAPMGELEPEEESPETIAATRAPVEDQAAPAEPDRDDPAEETPATDRAVAEAMAAIGADADPAAAPGPTLDVPRPAPRPGDAGSGAAAPAPDRSIGAGETTIEALAKGTRLVQLGAFESAEVAREHWGEVGARFADAFADKRMVVQQATSGGKPFYRLRAAGFADLAEAESFCSRLLAGQADCIPVEVR